jgi:hypothetical protein
MRKASRKRCETFTNTRDTTPADGVCEEVMTKRDPFDVVARFDELPDDAIHWPRAYSNYSQQD